MLRRKKNYKKHKKKQSADLKKLIVKLKPSIMNSGRLSKFVEEAVLPSAVRLFRVLGINDVNAHLTRLEKAKRLIPRYKECRISGAVAGMVIANNVATDAIRNGLYVIGL